MAKIRNRTIHSDDQEYLKFLAEELDFIGRAYRLDLAAGTITQIARTPSKRQRGPKAAQNRNKRAESAGRNVRD